MVPYLFIVLQRNRTYQRLRRLMPGCLLRRVERQHSLTTTSMPFGTNRSHQHLITCTTRHSIVRHAPQCRVLPPSEFNGMVTEPLIPVALLKYKHGYKPANIATKTCDQKQYLTGCYGQGNYTVSQKNGTVTINMTTSQIHVIYLLFNIHIRLLNHLSWWHLWWQKAFFYLYNIKIEMLVQLLSL